MVLTGNLLEMRRKTEKKDSVVARWSLGLWREEEKRLDAFESWQRLKVEALLPKVLTGTREYKIKHLSLLKDVVFMIKEMDSTPEFVCWPRLQTTRCSPPVDLANRLRKRWSECFKVEFVRDF